MNTLPDIDSTEAPVLPGSTDVSAEAAILESCHASSQATYEALLRPLPAFSPRRAWFGLQKWSLATAGRLSRGIRIGWKTGFDSGESLDHVYRNEAEGLTPLGRWIDRVYLDSPGWRGIRTRGIHLAKLLDGTLRDRAAGGDPVHVLDVACGGGRYVLETLHRLRGLPVTAELRDASATALGKARDLATSLELEGRVTIRPGDAFDPAQITGTDPRPDVAIVSGLFELFSSNDPIRSSLGGLAELLPPGTTLLYTNQPCHPQQEMIARVLPNRDGDPWVMRIRSQEEMDALVREAGFSPQERLADEAGIFTVSRATRR